MDSISYVLWGSSGHAKVLSSLITLIGGHTIALFDNNPDICSSLENVPLHIGIDGFKHWITEQNEVSKINGIAAIGGSRGQDRLVINDLFRTHGLSVQSLIHPSASVCTSASIGAGSQILAQAIVASDARLGECCIINHRASVDHECVIGNGVHLAPSSTLCGCITVGNNVMIGAGAVVLPRLKIGNNTIVGAGAVVTRDLQDGIVAFGNPAKVVRTL
jgi:sugar O-acyltransferase (sialic acid O-acetyltransferase NeuD family)